MIEREAHNSLISVWGKSRDYIACDQNPGRYTKSEWRFKEVTDGTEYQRIY